MADSPVRVFVSHHHSPDEDTFTAQLVADLESAGVDVWVDTAGIPSGSFVAKISQGLEGRQWLVLVMTPAALTSLWVRAEVEAALQEVHTGRMLGVVPLMMQPCRDQDMPILWRTLQRYDATRDYQGAVAGLLRALGLADFIQPSIPADRFPPRLASLGYQGRMLSGTEVIIPPMCEVPAGPFLMGSDLSQDNRADYSETPQKWVTLPDFAIARYPVTVAEYACFVRSGHDEPKDDHKQLDWNAQLQRLDHPVVAVSWHDATAYTAWLTHLTGQPWRLPSEAEWEKGARGRDGRIYPWGDAFDLTRANTGEGRRGATTPVGSFPSGASPYGAQDMAGNVMEWTSSLREQFKPSRSGDRETLIPIESRVLRGGAYSSDSKYTRVACRSYFFEPDASSTHFGFRLARSV